MLCSLQGWGSFLISHLTSLLLPLFMSDQMTISGDNFPQEKSDIQNLH